MTGQRTTPLVSVVMPVHNREEYVEEAVESILTQSHGDLELIVVDDRSTDSTVERVRRFSDDGRVVLLTSPRPGVSAARNTALDVATGDFLLWQDSDDVAAPCRIERLLSEVCADVAYAHSDLSIIDSQGRSVGLATVRHVPADSYLPTLLRWGNPILYPSMLLRTAAARGLRFREDLTVGEDMDFARRFAPGRRGVHVPEPLLSYRRHSANATTELTPEMVRPSLVRMLSEEPLEKLAPEVFRAYRAPDTVAVARAVVALKLSLRGWAAEAVEWFVSSTSADVTADGRSVVSAVLHLASGEPRQAFDELHRARPTAVTHALAGEAQLVLSRPADAAASFRSALGLDPASFDGRSGLAVASRLAHDPSLMSVFGSHR